MDSASSLVVGRAESHARFESVLLIRRLQKSCSCVHTHSATEETAVPLNKTTTKLSLLELMAH